MSARVANRKCPKASSMIDRVCAGMRASTLWKGECRAAGAKHKRLEVMCAQPRPKKVAAANCSVPTIPRPRDPPSSMLKGTKANKKMHAALYRFNIELGVGRGAS